MIATSPAAPCLATRCAGKERPLWFEAGATFVAIDTLVHNFLHRAGILQRLCADHAYGDRCYRPGGCASVLRLVAANIDARQFNRAFPATFPRFVQSAIWAYCAESRLDICNGNRIDDDSRCDNRHCQLFRRCGRPFRSRRPATYSSFDGARNMLPTSR
jgi:hypothetical protein